MVGMHCISYLRADKEELKDLMALCSNWQNHKVCTPVPGAASWFQLRHYCSSRQLPNQPSSAVANRWGIHPKLREKQDWPSIMLVKGFHNVCSCFVMRVAFLLFNF